MVAATAMSILNPAIFDIGPLGEGNRSETSMGAASVELANA
jgi:hypothetical protein